MGRQRPHRTGWRWLARCVAVALPAHTAGAQLATLSVADVVGYPGETVAISVYLDADVPVAAIRNDLLLPNALTIDTSAAGGPDCAPGSMASTELSSFAYWPPGCADAGCAVRASVFGHDVGPLPVGGLLYSCAARIAPGARPGTHVGLTVFNAMAAAPDAVGIPAQGSEGVLVVLADATPSPTSPPPTIRPTPTAEPATPVGRAPASIGPYGGSVTQFVVTSGSPPIVFAALQGAGVFSSRDAGGTWTPAASFPFGDRVEDTPTVFAVATDGRAASTVYAATSRGVFASSDDGRSWEPLTSPPSTAVTILIDPLAPETIYAGTDRHGVVRSRDGGRTWTSISQATTGLAAARVTTLAGYPAMSGLLYAGTVGSGIFVSSDLGETWTPVNVGLPAVASRTVISLAADPRDRNVAYAGIRTTTGVIEGSLFKTVDAGATWRPAREGLGQENGLLVFSLELDADDPSRLFAGLHQRGAFSSDDAAATWHRIGFESHTVTALMPLPSEGSLLASAFETRFQPFFFSGGAQVYRSLDGGDTWTPSNRGLAGSVVRALALGNVPRRTLYVGDDANGVLRTENEGALWVRGGLDGSALPDRVTGIHLEAAGDTTRIYATSGGSGVFRSDDGGRSWRTIRERINFFTYAVTRNPRSETVFIGGNGGVYRSRDRGVTWESRNDGLQPNSALTYALAVDTGDPTTLYAGGNGLYRSRDDAESWSRVAPGFPPIGSIVRAVAVNPSDPSHILVGTDRGCFMSDDDGGHFGRLDAFDDTIVQSIAFDQVDPARVLVGTYGRGASYSADGGATWTCVQRLPGADDVRSVLIGDSGEAYLGSTAAGVVRFVLPGFCSGDCDCDGSVTVGELVRAVRIVLGDIPVSDCRPADGNGDGGVVVAELISGVAHTLEGCWRD